MSSLEAWTRLPEVVESGRCPGGTCCLSQSGLESEKLPSHSRLGALAEQRSLAGSEKSKEMGRKEVFAVSWPVRIALRKNSTKVLDPGLLTVLHSGGA